MSGILENILRYGWAEDYKTDAVPIDRRMDEVLEAIPGYTMTTRNHMYLISELVQQTEAKIYIEAGVWVGHTLLSAAANNPKCMCIGIDDFSAHPDIPRLQEAMEIFPRNVHMFATSFQEFFDKAQGFIDDKSVDIYYYDADHSTKSTYEGLVLAEPYLSDECYLLIDDVNMQEARDGVNLFLKEYLGWYTRLTIPDWYNGLSILRRRNV